MSQENTESCEKQSEQQLLDFSFKQRWERGPSEVNGCWLLSTITPGPVGHVGRVGHVGQLRPAQEVELLWHCEEQTQPQGKKERSNLGLFQALFSKMFPSV